MVVDASAVVVVGSSMMSGAGRAVEVLVDSPMTRPFSVLEPPEQAPVTKATERARPTTPVRRKVECKLMAKWATFPERVESLDLAFSSAWGRRWGSPTPRLRPIRLKEGRFLPAAPDR